MTKQGPKRLLHQLCPSDTLVAKSSAKWLSGQSPSKWRHSSQHRGVGGVGPAGRYWYRYLLGSLTGEPKREPSDPYPSPTPGPRGAGTVDFSSMCRALVVHTPLTDFDLPLQGQAGVREGGLGQHETSSKNPLSLPRPGVPGRQVQHW